VQRENIKKQLLEDRRFQGLTSYFTKGVFVTGAIEHDLYAQGETAIVHQFLTALECREELIASLSDNSDPIQVQESCMSEFRKIQESHRQELENLKLDMERTLQIEEQNKKQVSHAAVKSVEALKAEYEQKVQQLEDAHRAKMENIGKEKLCTIS
jgi:hypothetical protein